MKLSILILWLTNRNTSKLLKSLDKQSRDWVEILSLIDNKRWTVSDKRNQLISMCKWEYISFIDDDDEITDDYIEQLLEWIEHWTDVVNFKLWISIDWAEYKDVLFSKEHQNIYKDWFYYRQPNHIMCIKKELAKKFPYRNIPWEDTDFAERINSSIKTEYNIDKTLYYYNFSSIRSECQWTEHYNINRWT